MSDINSGTNENKNKIIRIVLIAILIFILITVLILWLLGFRPVEEKDVIISYDVIYIFVQLASVVSLVATVVYQVGNNDRIAERQEDLLKEQNKITLFEKRYETYTSLKFILNLVHNSFNISTDDFTFRKYFLENIEHNGMTFDQMRVSDIEARRVMSVFIANVDTVLQGKLLFNPSKWEDVEEFMEMIKPIIDGVKSNIIIPLHTASFNTDNIRGTYHALYTRIIEITCAEIENEIKI